MANGGLELTGETRGLTEREISNIPSIVIIAGSASTCIV